MFIGGYFLRFIGTCIIYLYEISVAFIQKKKIPSFKDVWSIPNANDFFSSVSFELKQKLVGFIFLILVFILMYLSTLTYMM
jgi:hypothetical protein